MNVNSNINPVDYWFNNIEILKHNEDLKLLVFNEEIRSLILHKSSAEEIRRAAVSTGMQSLYDNGMSKSNEFERKYHRQLAE